MPEKLCGTPVKSKPLERLLPEGRRLKEKSSRGTNGTSCDVLVDGKLSIAVEESHPPKYVKAMKFGLPENPVPIRNLPYKGEGRVDDDNSVVIVPCRTPRTRYLAVRVTSIRTPDDIGAKDLRKSLRELVVPATAEIKKEKKCGS
ncbi:hypothetical protein [Streptomyces sp. NPDC006925]|uniref:hypothetical protein n=1 Tax=Streptomyces sp. NPDC006925 TaxID=3364768 RepID=UPI003687FEC7